MKIINRPYTQQYKTLRIRIFLWVVFGFIVGSGYAQKLTLPNYKHYTMHDGLPQMQVTSLFQDSRGYLWVGTKNGIARFDGEKFTPFNAQKGFSFDYVHNIFEDSQSRIIAVCSTGIARFDGDSIQNIQSDKLRFIRAVQGRNDTIWLHGYLLENDMGVIAYFAGSEFKILKTPNDLITRHLPMFYDSKSERLLFHAENKGIFEYKNKKIRLLLDFPGSNRFTYFIETNKEPCYLDISPIKTEYDSSFSIDFYKIPKNNLSVSSLPKEPSARLTQDGWIKSFPNNFLSANWSFYYRNEIPNFLITPQGTQNIAFDNASISCTYIDRYGTLWIGTESGLYQTLPHAFTNYNPEVVPNVWSVIEHPKNKYWIASYENGLKTLQGNTLKNIPNQIQQKLYFYFSPALNTKGDLFFPTHTGILKKSGKGEKDRLIQIRENGMDPIPTCFTVYFDKKQNLILGSFRGNIGVFDDNGNYLYAINKTIENSQIYGYTYHITPDVNDNLWFGGARLYRYNWEKKELREYGKDIYPVNSYSAVTDYRGRTWFATSNGLLFHDIKTDKLLSLQHEELQGNSSFVTAIDSSFLLIGQVHGLYTLNLNEYYKSGNVQLQLYNKNNGYLGIDAGQDGAFTDSDGQIWITSSSCLSRLDPAKLQSNLVYAKIIFQSCNNRPVLYTSSDIRLAKNQQSAIVTFETVTFNRPLPVEYSYKVGENEEWSSWQTSDYVVLSNLSHGKNNLYLKSRFPGLPNVIHKTQQLIILADLAFYKQKWFLPSLFLLLLIILIGTFIGYALTRVRLEKTLQEVKLSEVTAIQSQLNPHFVFNVLTSVQNKIQNEDKIQAENYLLKMANLIRRFLHLSIRDKNTKNTIFLKKLHVNPNAHLVSLQDELIVLLEFVEFQQMMFPGYFEYELHIDPAIDIEKIGIPPLLLQPIAENAITHGLIPKSANGLLTIHLSESAKNKIEISIKDNGIGIEKSEKLHHEEVFRFPSLGNKLSEKRIKLLQELGVDILVKTQSSDEGTIVTIKINKYELSKN